MPIPPFGFSATISDDEKWLVTSDSRIVTWRNLVSGKPELQLYYIDEGKDWIYVAADNRFDASEGGQDYIAFKRKGTSKILPADSIHSRLYTPGLMTKVLGQASNQR